MPNSHELLVFFDKLHDQSLEFLRDVRFEKQPQQDCYIVCIYASMIELCGGILVLVRGNRRISVSPVFRTLLEAYADFKNMLQDPAYVNYCYARHHQDWINILESNQRPNPFLVEIHGHKDRDAALERYKNELQRLAEEGVHPLRVSERFEMAGITDEYLSIYHFESDAIHNSWQALIGRHFEEIYNGFGLSLYKERSLDEYVTHLDSSIALLLDATDKVHRRFGSDHQAAIEELWKELSAIREKPRRR